MENTPLKVNTLTNISNDILVAENSNTKEPESKPKTRRGRKPAEPRDPNVPNARDVLQMLEKECNVRITSWGADGKNAKAILDSYGATPETLQQIKGCYEYLTRHSFYGKEPISLGLVNKFMQKWLDLGQPFDEAEAAVTYNKQRAAKDSERTQSTAPAPEERDRRIQNIIDLQGIDYAIKIGLVPPSAKQGM